MQSPTHPGQRILLRRQSLGLSRQVLAGLVGRSSEWLRRIENGSRELDSISVTLQLASILKFEHLDELLDLGHETVQWGRPRTGLSAELRIELALPVWLGHHRAYQDTAADLDRLRQLWWYAPHRISELDRGLVELIPTSRANRQLRPGDPGCAGDEVDVLNLARSYLTFVGERGLALMLAERAMVISEASSDTAAAVALRGLALAHLQNRQFVAALALATAGAERIGSGSPIAQGSLLGIGAKAAAQLADHAQAARLIDRARLAAAAVGPDRQERGVWFGPGDVALTEMTLAWIAGEHDKIVAIAEHWSVQGAHLPPHIRIPFHALIAAVYARSGEVGTAMTQLHHIEQLSPEALVHNTMVHIALRSLTTTHHPIFTREIQRMTAAVRAWRAR
ncbi:transcriptional regulator with XRE-family HTH domain [Allocatelliglobosispora scoriae]|uniref:Transcriptional regulator with XRE-family HTH domain n=1 Tax=Allocatelliglobosispora scoriae TaxID=643052 RepID=A0A841BIE2_9ACTN|nr:transcriptional regulator [Allocatelliglobosispora scoriae]MBB5866833.1 transcriptional regulator with XRE-family HTH domain [Allocatelliglobosispora scoriae]